jgi:hypothetical protein
MMLALRPPNSGGLPGTSQPLSSSSRFHSRAQVGTCDDDRGRTSASAAAGGMLVEKGRKFGADGLDLGIERQLHGTPECAFPSKPSITA